MAEVNYEALRKQIEYYLSDKNLKQDEFFYKAIKESNNNSLSIDLLLNCNKVKQLKATKEDIIKALSESDQVEVLPDQSGVKRKNETLPEYEPKPGKKVKKNNGEAEEAKSGEEGFTEFIFIYKLDKPDENIKWDTIQSKVQEVFGIKVQYSRLNQTEGHFCVDKRDLTNEIRTKITQEGLKIGDVTVNIEECSGEDLKKFYKDHGRHLDTCLERVGLKKKNRGSKAPDFIFNGQRHKNLSQLRNLFRNILQKTADFEPIPEPDHSHLLELLKYHDNYENKVKDLKHFTAGPHPEYKATRCFFVVRNDGSKEDFSSTKCLDNIKKKFELTD